jgi:hypothetical protein
VVWLGSYRVELLNVSDMQVDVQVLLLRRHCESVRVYPIDLNDGAACSRQKRRGHVENQVVHR